MCSCDVAQRFVRRLASATSGSLPERAESSTKIPFLLTSICKGKGLQPQTEVAQGVPGRLRHRILLTFGTTRVVDRQPYALATFTPGEIPGTHF
jgi:hypothetical protein